MPQISAIPQVTQAPFVEGDMCHNLIRDALRVFTQLMTNQAQVVTNNVASHSNLGVGSQQNASTPTSRMRDFMTMNPYTFHDTKMEEDQEGFMMRC